MAFLCYFRCECLAGFDGPRCQQTKHSFAGKGWAWFEPLAQCEDSHTSIEFLTQDPNGLIMYNGPISALKSDDPTDFISLELVGGHPKLRIDHGSGETSVSLPRQNLADGVWHRIDIFRTGKVGSLLYLFYLQIYVVWTYTSKYFHGVVFDRYPK